MPLRSLVRLRQRWLHYRLRLGLRQNRFLCRYRSQGRVREINQRCTDRSHRVARDASPARRRDCESAPNIDPADAKSIRHLGPIGVWTPRRITHPAAIGPDHPRRDAYGAPGYRGTSLRSAVGPIAVIKQCQRGKSESGQQRTSQRRACRRLALKHS
jgi:hypothetical protein